jgi:hypothetical protein
VIEALVILAGLLLLGLALWEQKQFTGGARQLRERPTFCAWCVWRDGETCTQPASPVSGQSCGPVCIGQVKCEARRLQTRRQFQHKD